MTTMKKALIAILLGSALPPGVTADEQSLYAIGTAPSAARIQSDIETLVSFGTRHTLSETDSDTRGIGAARRWIKAEFDAIAAACGGCLEVFYVSDIVSGTNRIPGSVEVVNVIAVQRGTRDTNRYVMMTGDIDNRISDPMNFTNDSPGANDNASGMAGVLETARVLSQYQFPGSIIYAGLSGEEQGLNGGAIFASWALERGWDMQVVINNDMIGNIRGITGVVNNTTARVFSEGTRYDETPEEAAQRRSQGGEVDSPSRNVARYIDQMADLYVPNLDVMMVYRLDRFGRGGHHRPFNEAGIPAVRIMETNENYNWQHNDVREEDGIAYGDVIEHVDFDYAAKLAALNAVTLASMAWAPAPPKEVSITGQISADTTLRWSKVPGATGYRLHWRLTTEPQWTYSRTVGDVEEFTPENVVIDNYYFGVSSLSETGVQSPVVFPGPAGAF